MNRPSLLSAAGATGTGAVNSRRILADMEGRTPERAPVAREVVRRVPWRLAISATLLVLFVLALLAAWRWNRGSSSYEDAVTPHAVAPTSQAPAQSQFPASSAGGAMIVDETLPADAVAGAPAATATAATATATPAHAQAIERPEQGAAIATATSKRTSAATSPRRKLSAKEEEDLLGTLIGIIRQKPAERKPESMDALIAKIQADRKQADSSNKAAFDSIDQNASTQSSIQAKLRRCPAANTLQGIECRRKICASLPGKDPACPAR